jgi:hypothetical protein
MLSKYAKETKMDIRVADDMDHGAKIAASIVNKKKNDELELTIIILIMIYN